MSHKMGTTLKHMRRSPYQSIAAGILTTITFFVVSVFALVVMGAHGMLTYFESRPQVTAFFKDSATAADVAALKTSVSALGTVESMNYISKDQALQIYKDQNKDNPLLLEMVTADILPASLEVSAKNATDLEGIAAVMQKDTSVEEVVFQKDVVDTLTKWVNGVRIAGVVLSGLLLFASLVTIIVILGLKFTARRAEIKTLSLLGATSWYIRGPFVLDGIAYGLIGAGMGWGAAYIALLYATPPLATFLQGIPLLPVPLWIMGALLGGELVLGMLLGGFASMIATRRYGR